MDMMGFLRRIRKHIQVEVEVKSREGEGRWSAFIIYEIGRANRSSSSYTISDFTFGSP
jgi:hypothetical protein